MSDHGPEYWLNSASYLLGGLIVSAIYWRWFYHRILVSGGGKKEPPLAIFTALIVGMVAALGFLYTVNVQTGKDRLATRTQDQVSCLVGVIQYNFGLINDRAKLQKDVSTAQQRFYLDLLDALVHPIAPTDQNGQTVAVHKFTVDTEAVVAAQQAIDDARDARPYATGKNCV